MPKDALAEGVVPRGSYGGRSGRPLGPRSAHGEGERWPETCCQAPFAVRDESWQRGEEGPSRTSYATCEKVRALDATPTRKSICSCGLGSRLYLLGLGLDYRALGGVFYHPDTTTEFPSWATFGRAGLNPSGLLTVERAGLDFFSQPRAQGNTPRFLWRRNSGKA